MDRKSGLVLSAAIALILPVPLAAKLTISPRKPPTAKPKDAGALFSLDALQCSASPGEPGVMLIALVHRDVEGLVLYHWKDVRRGDALAIKEVRRFERDKAPRDVTVDLFREHGKDGVDSTTSALIDAPGEYEIVSVAQLEEEDGMLPVVGSCRFTVTDVH